MKTEGSVSRDPLNTYTVLLIWELWLPHTQKVRLSLLPPFKMFG